MMKFHSRVIFLLVLTIHTVTGLVGKERRSLIPIESFFRPAKISDTSLSPDGRYLAGLAPIDKGNEIGLVMIDLETLKPKTIKFRAGFNIYRYDWVNDTDIIFNAGKWNSYVAGLYRVNRENRTVVALMDGDIVARMVDPMTYDPKFSWIWVRMHSPDGENPRKHKLVKLRKKGRAGPRNFSNSEGGIDSFSLVQESVSPPPGQIFGWGTDWTGRPRIVRRYHKDRLQYMHRNSQDEDWSALPIDTEDWRVVNFDQNNRLLYLTGYNGKQTRGLYIYDIEKDSVGDQIFRDQEYDYTAAAHYKYHKDTLLGISYHRDKPSTVWFLPEMKSLQSLVDRSIPNRTNVISDWSDDLKKLLISSYSGTAPVRYLLFDRERRILKLIVASAPWIDDAKLARTNLIRFKTSDGLKLEGYLIVPNGSKPPYPMVCLVHGGPWSRDTGGYDAEAQFLANRGYAVLKINYRGSTGYGKLVSEEPAYQFRKMHDDITEAVGLMVKQGIADANRLAIMGASFWWVCRPLWRRFRARPLQVRGNGRRCLRLGNDGSRPQTPGALLLASKAHRRAWGPKDRERKVQRSLAYSSCR